MASSLSDQVTQVWLPRIGSGQLKAGEKHSDEAVIAPEFGVCRTVIRHAISRLEHGGLVESRQGIGVLVSLEPATSPLKIEDWVMNRAKRFLKSSNRCAIESGGAPTLSVTEPAGPRLSGRIRDAGRVL